MFCPLHEDSKRSASLNVHSGEWYCFAGCGGGRVTDLIRRRSEWFPPSVAAFNGGQSSRRPGQIEEIINDAKIAGWHSGLLSNEIALDDLISERAVTTDTVIRWEIGWDRDRRVYTIPIRGPDREIWNVRRYNLRPAEGRRKIWSVKGMGSPRLYPIEMLESEQIIICEGEWDALLTIQNGYSAVTRTAAADVWRPGWSELFLGKRVYLCHDMDEKGQIANRKVARYLARIADVRLIRLPYEVVPKHGKDLTDFWQEHDRSDFEKLLSEAQPYRSSSNKEPETITVLDSFDARRVGDPVRMVVTIKGKKEPGYMIPSRASLTCTRDAGAKCAICPLNAAGGAATLTVNPDNPITLSMLDASNNSLHDLLRQEYGALKCNRLHIDIEERQSVEVLYARPSLDHSDGSRASEYKNVRITNVGRHDTASNNTVLVTGARHPNPKDQRNEFLAWEIERLETSVDRFEVTPGVIKMLKMFQPRRGQRPMKKLADISSELSKHVTKIVGRPEMHAVMDLTFHSVLMFKFGGQVLHRGWLESLIIGDTRTGKSAAATNLVRHYGAGEIVGGEAATYAGVVGGLQQMGGKEWIVTWGVIPLNDRRLVCIDEVSGMSWEDISRMSDIRESGLAKLTMIQQDVTHARTRLLWLSNPRNARMSDYTYGVQALYPLIGNAEDIARFDLAIALHMSDIPSEKINQPGKIGELRYTSEACHNLLMWSWTRQPDQVIWTPATEKLVFKAATELGGRYVEDPPLLQAANARLKIARVAVAMAARTFSTDNEGEKLIIKPEHVQDSVRFIDHLYSMPAFGYAERSAEVLGDRKEAQSNKETIRRYLHERKGLDKFLRNTGKFRRQDLEEIMNVSREESNAILNKLWEARMIRKEGGDVRIEPTLHEILREIKS
jgi:5S rRNA maturation endonuclease (ribonuclease M5)